jgi:heptaprenyl diphosphate synthase
MSDSAPEHVEILTAFGESLGMAFQLSDDVMDFTATQMELQKEPGQDVKEGVYTLPVLHALRAGSNRDELARILSLGTPDGELLDRAIELIWEGGSIEHARDAVSVEVRRANELAQRLPGGPARHALVQLARFLATRSGADPGPGEG